jgi:rSAM/selenodomain-associated transferase 1
VNVQVIVLAKTPVPGRVKTRLCPPWTPPQAARLAAAALEDTLDVVSAAAVTRRILVVEGDLPAPMGWSRVAQRGSSLGERIANAFTDTTAPGTATVLIGMDTPQISTELLHAAVLELVAGAGGAVLGPAEDGGWWGLGLRDPANAQILRDIPTSTGETGALTLDALKRKGLRPTVLPMLRDVDTAADAHIVASLCPTESRFARTVALLG